MEPLTKPEIGGDVIASPEGIGRRYEAILRLSEALSHCQEPEDLTEILSKELHEFLTFLQFYIIVYKENSIDVEWAVVGREKNQVVSYADVPVQQRPSWQAYIQPRNHFALTTGRPTKEYRRASRRVLHL